MACDRTAKIHAYHDGALPAAERVAVEAHLRSCDGCSTLLADLRTLSRRVDEAALAPMPVDVMARLRRRVPVASVARSAGPVTGWMTAAAAAVLVVVSLVGRSGDGGETITDTGEWEAVALGTQAATRAEGGSELVQVAQLMATGLESVGR